MIKRKHEHLELALHSQTGLMMNDERFDYEPLLSAHPDHILKPFEFLGKTMKVPIWISSMTGGSESSGFINGNLARACNEFGMGMGLGSCRSYLEERKYFDHFNLRELIGDDYPLYANLGIRQIEDAVKQHETESVAAMVHDLKADGLIIHVNPFQEWLQPEGERINVPPVESISKFLSETNLKVIVKEVGQGFGPASLGALLQLPLEAIELAAFGGTNFASLELKRSGHIRQKLLEPLSLVGNNVENMINTINHYMDAVDINIRCRSIIISGGIRNFLDGYYFMQKSKLRSVYGQASSFLKYAKEGYQIKGLELATAYLRIRKDPAE